MESRQRRLQIQITCQIRGMKLILMFHLFVHLLFLYFQSHHDIGQGLCYKDSSEVVLVISKRLNIYFYAVYY